MMERFRQPEKFVAWLPFATLLQKVVRRFLRVSFQTLLAPIVTASLYLFVFCATLGERISVLEGFSYAQFVIPGLILMGVITNSFANTSSSCSFPAIWAIYCIWWYAPRAPLEIRDYTSAGIKRKLTLN